MIEKNIPLAELARQTAAAFEQRFCRPPRWMAAAPGRVNLIGEHTDYNDGFVFPMALERYTVIAAAPSQEPVINLASTTAQDAARIDLTVGIERGHPSWANYCRGVMVGFQRLGCALPGFDALIHSSLPLGGGVSSSAALEVSTATLLEAITGRKLDPVKKALLCQKAEHEYALMPCGIMDQFISVMGRPGHVLLLDCQSRRPTLVPMKSRSVEVLVINTNVKHELTGSEYPERRKQCELAAKLLGVPSLRHATLEMIHAAPSGLENVVFRRARHVVTEIARTTEAAAAIAASDWKTAGELMYASHGSLRGDYEVSCKELDDVVAIAHGIGLRGGVYGCRMTGGGFGGCAVALVKTSAVARIAARIEKAYRQATGIEPTLFVSRPGSGASLLKG